MYTIIFSDGKEFKFTKNQIILIPYFNTLINSASFIEKDIISISSSSIGFEYIHIYATMNEIDILDPQDKYLFTIKQCDYFGYDKLKTLLENKYGYKIDITNIKNNIGSEITVKLKYLGKFKIITRELPNYRVIKRMNYDSPRQIEFYITGKTSKRISGDGKGEYCNNYNRFIKSSPEVYLEFTLYKYFAIYASIDIFSGGYSSYSLPQAKWDKTHIKIKHPPTNHKICDTDIIYNNTLLLPIDDKIYNCESINPSSLITDIKIYCIEPIYEYPEYSTDNEINGIFKKRYRMTYNIYFIQLIQSILVLNKDEIVCAKIYNSYKLLSEINKDEYENIEHIIVRSELKFNNKCFIKYTDNESEVYESI